METITVKAQRVEGTRQEIPYASSKPSLAEHLARARAIAILLDSKFSLGGIRFGMDAILGLIPGVGDAVSAGIGAYLIYVAHRHQLGKVVIARMLWNLLLDWLVGLVPVLGDIFDVFMRAHLRNLKILEEAAAKRGI